LLLQPCTKVVRIMMVMINLMGEKLLYYSKVAMLPLSNMWTNIQYIKYPPNLWWMSQRVTKIHQVFRWSDWLNYVKTMKSSVIRNLDLYVCTMTISNDISSHGYITKNVNWIKKQICVLQESNKIILHVPPFELMWNSYFWLKLNSVQWYIF